MNREWKYSTYVCVSTCCFAYVNSSIQGEYAEAVEMYERCQMIREKALRPDHPDLASTFNNRAGLLESMVRARVLFQELLLVHVIGSSPRIPGGIDGDYFPYLCCQPLLARAGARG